MIQGVDISHYDENINWQVLSRNVGFVYIKATEGLNFKDQAFDANWSNALNHGLIRGSYHVLHAKDDIQAQADFFLNTVGPGLGDLPLMLDWEESINPEPNLQACLDFLQALKLKTGKDAGIYGSVSALSAMNFPMTSIANPLWIAEYGVRQPKYVFPWGVQYTFWQNSESAYIQGIPGKVDTNIFLGTMQDLKSL